MEAPSVDLGAATRFLRDRFGRTVRRVEAAPRQGDWSRTYFFVAADDSLAVRFAPWRTNFDTDRVIAERFSSHALPVPRIREIGEARAFRCWYAISNRAYGAPLEDVDADEARHVLPSLFRALDAMRGGGGGGGVDLSAGRGAGAWRLDGSGESRAWQDYLLEVATDPGDAFPDRPHGWRAKLARHPEREAAFSDAYRELVSLVPACPELRHLLHSDLLYGNVLVDGRRVSAVLDWGCALIGDFLYDLAWLTFWAPWTAGLSAVDLRDTARHHFARLGVAVPDFDHRVRCYEVHIGLAGLVYQVFTEDWDEYDTTSGRLAELLA